MSWLFRLFLAAVVCNVFSWIILIPVWQYPDEQAHFAQVQDMAELDRVPLGMDTSYEIALSEKIFGTERDQLGNNKFTYHPEYKLNLGSDMFGPGEKELLSLDKEARLQMVKKEATLNPPLYYFLGSIIYRVFSNYDLMVRVYAARLFSVLLILLTMVLSYKIGELVFGRDNLLVITLASLVAFMPMLVFASSGVLPDPLTNLLFVVVIFLSMKILNGAKIPYLATLVLVIILGVLTRQQFLISLFFVLIAVLFRLINSRRFRNRIFSGYALIIFGVLLILKDKIFRFLVTSPFRVPESADFDFRKLFDFQFVIFLESFIKQTYAQTLPWYWGVYKWLSLTLPHVSYQVINRIIVVAILGILLRIGTVIINRKGYSDIQNILFLITISVIYFLIFAIWDYFFFLSHGFHFGYQGRYFFPLIVGHMAILLWGIWHFFKIFLKKNTKYVLIIVTFLMIFFNNFSLYYVAASYYDVSSLDIFIKQVSQYKPGFLKGDILYVLLVAPILFQSIYLFMLSKLMIETKN